MCFWFSIPDWWSVQSPYQNVIGCIASITQVHFSPTWKSKMKAPQCCFFRSVCQQETAQQCLMLSASGRRNSQNRGKEFTLLTDTDSVVCSGLSCYLRAAAAWPITEQCPHLSQKENCDIIIHSPGGHNHSDALDHLLPRDLSSTALHLWALCVSTPFSVLHKAIFLILHSSVAQPIWLARNHLATSKQSKNWHEFGWAQAPKNAPSKIVPRRI